MYCRRTLLLFQSVLLFTGVFCAGGARALEISGSSVLIDKYQQIKDILQNSSLGVPLFIESHEETDALQVDIYGTVDYPFERIRETFPVLAHWCDIVPLHLNIKACTFKKQNDLWLITLYSGRKYYQSPEDAQEVQFRFRVAAQQPEYLALSLIAEEGPLHTRDHRIEFDAIPLEGGKSFLHLRYAYRFDSWTRTAMKTYFSTIGRGKVGFTVTGRDDKGNPVYVGGVKGAIERNAVRYYFAIQAYMDSLSAPPGERFEARINRWYDLTDRFPQQLFELEKGEYLTAKRKERKNQLMLQDALSR
ncbi:MAG: hypothetical protein K8I29_03585 [Alphaproteobacteria bacterium]|uniref:Uncharacterized protein n=1 Tax=Candidatus Nitrobium versatile TaxID=2884831 RepID=A0A953M0J8_9BACT|nr:hypothetical protein [Candidatus Nitrobium versatile]